jgi:hypothetical protein
MALKVSLEEERDRLHKTEPEKPEDKPAEA